MDLIVEKVSESVCSKLEDRMQVDTREKHGDKNGQIHGLETLDEEPSDNDNEKEKECDTEQNSAVANSNEILALSSQILRDVIGVKDVISSNTDQLTQLSQQHLNDALSSDENAHPKLQQSQTRNRSNESNGVQIMSSQELWNKLDQQLTVLRENISSDLNGIATQNEPTKTGASIRTPQFWWEWW
ncbi:hypothetical protein RFI_02618 [Reticulomyxa filosa]|uniref:Uncharacterized protein n=1 Tax=Reticulomyxa filosa TaxID=46433 RepID=X6P8F8_RETFI|nr:hypothetical protein RFI_02618 [Reticulomyxa filosa]|eukprot:ETO34476.1 hypothetical protein RFI_02618 [Reticulomyxa filosa]